VVGKPHVEVGRHLAQLHEGALHVAEDVGHLLGGPQLELPVEVGLPGGGGERSPGPVQREVGPGPPADPGQLQPPSGPRGAPHRRRSGLARPVAPPGAHRRNGEPGGRRGEHRHHARTHRPAPPSFRAVHGRGA
jgi:hypothetical protein